VNAAVVVDVSGLRPGELRALEAGERQVLLCNVAGEYFALENRCPHAEVPLSGGRLEGTVLECPLHGGKLDVRDGSPQRLPIHRNAVTFPVRRIDGGVEIDLSVA